MSRMIRSARSPEAGSASARSPRVSCHAGWVSPSGAPKNCDDVAAGDVGELLAPLVRRHPAVRADGPQQRAGQCAGADAGLDDVRAREDVGERDDLGGVLGVDDRGAARHRDDELREQRPEAEVLAARGRRDGEALLAADQLVVLDVAAVGEEALAGHELEVVPATLLVDQPDPLTDAQRSAVDAGPGLGGHVRCLLGVGGGGDFGSIGGLGHPRELSARSRGTPYRRRRSPGRPGSSRPARPGGTPTPGSG